MLEAPRSGVLPALRHSHPGPRARLAGYVGTKLSAQSLSKTLYISPSAARVHPGFSRSLAFASTPSMAAMLMFSWLTILILVSVFCGAAEAYIPAQPTNSTALMDAIQNGPNASSTIIMQWFPDGQHTESVSYRLVGSGSQGVTKGALVHFTESLARADNFTSETPWIALVSCDANDTDASAETDIFTLARSLGAVSSLLYSLTYDGCIINPAYANPATFNQVMDIFSTESLATAQTIEDQFVAINSTRYGDFNSTLLNDTLSKVNYTMQTGVVAKAGYMFATLVAFNATYSGTSGNNGSSEQATSSSASNNPGPNTSLAMIILYAITGCVSALFCVVIASGAIRAIRHPERYGPRAGDPGFGGAPGTFGAAQSRARGLTRAILDTFPVVKFGSSPQEEMTTKDIESVPTDHAEDEGTTSKDGTEIHHVELRDWQAVHEHLERGSRDALDEEPTEAYQLATGGSTESSAAPIAGSSTIESYVRPRPRPRVSARAEVSGLPERDVVPDAIGTETCPICIVDFEEGDDLRVLPCEGHHRFHRECVDQWLLELSSSCPICRQDFHALEAMMARDDGGPLEPPHMPGASQRPWSSTSARFSRYLRFARRRVREREDGSGYDATDPPMPLAVETRV